MIKDAIMVKTQKCIEMVPADEIVFIQRDGRKIALVTDDNDFSYYEKMCNIEDALGQDFYKCHGGCIVNFRKVRAMRDQTIYFNNGSDIMLGRNCFIKTKQNFCIYVLKQKGKL